MRQRLAHQVTEVRDPSTPIRFRDLRRL